MTDQKNSHKGGCTGARISMDTDDGHIEKSKARVKYKMSIPLQEYQALARRTNPDNLRVGTGNNPRHGSRAPSEASDPGENDASPINSCIQSDKMQSPIDYTTTLNPHKRHVVDARIH